MRTAHCVQSGLPGTAEPPPLHWGAGHEAWQSRVDLPAPGRRPGKEPLPREVLVAIAEHRLQRLAVAEPVAGCRPQPASMQAAGVQGHVRDVQGRNWDLMPDDGNASGAGRWDGARRLVIDALRDQFDLA